MAGAARAEEQATRKRIHAIIHGIVQGVSFRAYTVHEARVLGLDGWVRNVPDGSVETVAEGPSRQLEAFISFLHSGSPSAHVSHVDVTWHPPQGDAGPFVILYT